MYRVINFCDLETKTESRLVTNLPAQRDALQIYATLIAYLILQLVEIPPEWGNKLLDKLRYLQAFMCQEISYVHWMEKIMKC